MNSHMISEAIDPKPQKHDFLCSLAQKSRRWKLRNLCAVRDSHLMKLSVLP